MSKGTLAQKVVDRLRLAGYVSLEKPLAIASVTFEFAGILVGGIRSNDLVIVIDTALEEPEARRVTKRVDSLVRALDISSSRRSLTAVLVGPTLAPAAMESLTGKSRVLTVPKSSAQDLDSIDQQLAVLLPLELVPATLMEFDSLAELRSEFGASVFAKAIEHAQLGVESIEKELMNVFAAAIDTKEDAS